MGFWAKFRPGSVGLWFGPLDLGLTHNKLADSGSAGGPPAIFTPLNLYTTQNLLSLFFFKFVNGG